MNVNDARYLRRLQRVQDLQEGRRERASVIESKRRYKRRPKNAREEERRG